MMVHNHGTEDGPGLGCPESRINGELKGKCMAAQVIPAQAVEAAAKELYKTAPFPLEHYDHVGILRILEAAAPHMLAAAWDEGMEATGDYPTAADYAINPYRPTE